MSLRDLHNAEMYSRVAESDISHDEVGVVSVSLFVQSKSGDDVFVFMTSPRYVPAAGALIASEASASMTRSGDSGRDDRVVSH